MSSTFTSTETRLVKALKPCGRVVACGGVVGMNQAAIHANPRDPGGLGFM